LGNRKFLDIAWSSPLESSGPAPYELAISQPAEMAKAELHIPTSFNLRRRFLVPEDDATRLHRRLGRIGGNALLRLNEALGYTGDVSPEPVYENSRPSRPLTVEKRRTKSMRPHRSK